MAGFSSGEASTGLFRYDASHALAGQIGERVHRAPGSGRKCKGNPRNSRGLRQTQAHLTPVLLLLITSGSEPGSALCPVHDQPAPFHGPAESRQSGQSYQLVTARLKFASAARSDRPGDMLQPRQQGQDLAAAIAYSMTGHTIESNCWP